MVRRLAIIGLLGFIVVVGHANGQQPTAPVGSTKELRQRALQFVPYVVRVEPSCADKSGRVPPRGFGLIVGSRGDDLYIATPYHVVWGGGGTEGCKLASDVVVAFSPPNGGNPIRVAAERMQDFKTETEDLAVVVVPGGRGRAPLEPASALARNRIEEGISVVTFGFAGGWIPSQPGILIDASPNYHELLFQGLPARRGISGAPIVTADAVVGIMLAIVDGNIEQVALPVWKIVELLEGWNRPTNLISLQRGNALQSPQPSEWKLSLELKGHQSFVESAAFSPDGFLIVTASDDNTAQVWDAVKGAALLTLKGHQTHVNSAVFSPDGRRIVTASDDQTARVWDAKTGAELLTLKGHQRDVNSAVFSPDGRRIATASDDQTARVWDAKTGAELLTLKGHQRDVYSAVFSPDGRRIVTASDDYTAQVWDAKSGAPLADFKGHKLSSVHFAAYSPDGRRIVSASADKTVRVWDAETGAELATLVGHQDSYIMKATFSPDGRLILTACHDGTARIWDSETGAAVATLKGPDKRVQSAAFAPDGRRIVAAAGYGIAIVWEQKPIGRQRTAH